MVDWAQAFIMGASAGFFGGIGGAVSEWLKVNYIHKRLDKIKAQLSSIKKEGIYKPE